MGSYNSHMTTKGLEVFGTWVDFHPWAINFWIGLVYMDFVPILNDLHLWRPGLITRISQFIKPDTELSKQNLIPFPLFLIEYICLIKVLISMRENKRMRSMEEN